MSSRRSIIIFLLVIFSLNLRVAPVDDLTCKNNSTAAQKTKCILKTVAKNLAINRPKKEGHMCKDFWGRESVSLENGVCVYVQVVKKERENPPKQYLTINPYSPLIWESIKDDTNFAFDSSTINHFKDFTQQCIDSIKNKKDITMSTYVTWKFRDASKKIFDFLLVYCCKGSSCFEEAKDKSEYLSFPQCASGSSNEVTTDESKWIEVKNSVKTALPVKREDVCHFTKRFDSSSKIDFDQPCNALKERSENCIVEMLTEQNPQNTLRYICCVFSAKSDPAALNAFDASVNLPLVSAIEKAEEVKKNLGNTMDKCKGHQDAKQGTNICYAHINLRYGSETSIDDSNSNVEKSIINVYKEDGIACKFVWVDADSLIPFLRCECDGGKKHECDSRFYESNFLNSFWNSLQTDNLCEGSNFTDERYIACYMKLEVKHEKIEITYGAVPVADTSLDKNKNNKCSDESPTITICFCRPSKYVTNDSSYLCNTLSNPQFKDASDNMNKKLIRPANALKDFKDVCSKKSVNGITLKMLDIDDTDDNHIKYIAFQNHVLCFTYISDQNNLTEVPDKSFIENQLNPNVDIFARIVCDQIAVEEANKRLINNCNCGFVEESDMQAVLCCCKSLEHFIDDN